MKCPYCHRSLEAHCGRCDWLVCPPDGDWHVTYDVRKQRLVERRVKGRGRE